MLPCNTFVWFLNCKMSSNVKHQTNYSEVELRKVPTQQKFLWYQVPVNDPDAPLIIFQRKKHFRYFNSRLTDVRKTKANK